MADSHHQKPVMFNRWIRWLDVSCCHLHLQATIYGIGLDQAQQVHTTSVHPYPIDHLCLCTYLIRQMGTLNKIV